MLVKQINVLVLKKAIALRMILFIFWKIRVRLQPRRALLRRGLGQSLKSDWHWIAFVGGNTCPQSSFLEYVVRSVLQCSDTDLIF